jgi:hypothetical protein
MLHFFDLYEQWLQARGLSHSKTVFRRWAEEEYCPFHCRLELLDPPLAVLRDRPGALRLRAHNTSPWTWQLRPAANTGIHAGYYLVDDQGRCQATGRGGFLAAQVPPGSSIDLTMPLPAIQQPGTYHLLLDLINEQQGWFYQFSSEPLIAPLQVE